MASETEDGKLWPLSIEKHFINIMIEEEHKGKMPNGQFVKGHWGFLQKELNACTNRNYSKAQLTQKCGGLKTAHRTFAKLLQRSGMRWDPISNTDTASEPTWAYAIAANIKYGNYRRKGLAHYDLLGQLFNTGTATGFNQFSSGQPCPDTNESVSTKRLSLQPEYMWMLKRMKVMQKRFHCPHQLLGKAASVQCSHQPALARRKRMTH